ncbi:molybdopterin oxidoreductase family protein, partial [Pseudomonas syringae pv. tagetis]
GLVIETVSQPDASPRITSLKGDPLDTFSRGHICPTAVALQDIQNDRDRLRQAMLRIGDQWQRIAWHEAFDLVAERILA